jgi:hypothetical protein
MLSRISEECTASNFRLDQQSINKMEAVSRVRQILSSIWGKTTVCMSTVE